VECRLNAEDPNHGFRPSPGRLTRWQPPRGFGIRVDTHCFEGYTVPPYYDSLIAKVMCHGATREAAIALTLDSLDRFGVEGISTTRDLLHDVVGSESFGRCEYWTRWLEEVHLPAAATAGA
jgi:acetyl-CoA carboxylase biotin carboxylase subunit